MFALEIQFGDGVSHPETIYVRRPQALIGSADPAHVAIEDLSALPYQLHISRTVGRGFQFQLVGDVSSEVASLKNGIFDGEATIEMGSISLQATSLDTDLLVSPTEPFDRAAVRVLRQALAFDLEKYPAIATVGSEGLAVSFTPDRPLTIGRSKECALRLDSSSISSKHARIGFESGKFWVEDLGSTNGTFVDGESVTGRVFFEPCTVVSFGGEIQLAGVLNEQQLATVQRGSAKVELQVTQSRYPALVSQSEFVRPARLNLDFGSNIVIGREPSCDIWVGSPHISRRHCSMEVAKNGVVSVTDESRNGVAYSGGVLGAGSAQSFVDRLEVFDFGSSVEIALCFSEEDETSFLDGSYKNVAATMLVQSNTSISEYDVEATRIGLPPVQKQSGIKQFFREFKNFGIIGKAAAVLFLVTLLTLGVVIISLILTMVK